MRLEIEDHAGTQLWASLTPDGRYEIGSSVTGAPVDALTWAGALSAAHHVSTQVYLKCSTPFWGDVSRCVADWAEVEWNRHTPEEDRV